MNRVDAANRMDMADPWDPLPGFASLRRASTTTRQSHLTDHLALLTLAVSVYFTAVSYQVFARKYRPQVFDDVLGQTHVVRTLKNAIEQRRLAHAYLFVGPRGTGKTSTARILAKALNCVHGPTPTPCGVCDSCREIAQGISLDVLEIDGASNNSVDQIRELRENVRFAPVKGRYKMYIIDEVHMLTQQAFNALLKTLEEPPPHVIFVFATTEPHKVLPTILSRCQRFDLHRIAPRIIADHLNFIAKQEAVTLSPEAASAIAVAADGGLRDAESMLDQLVAFCGNTINEEQVLEVFGLTAEQVVLDLSHAIVNGESTTALHIIQAQQEAGKDLSKLLSDLLNFFRSLLIAQVDSQSLQDELSESAKEAADRLGAKLSTGQLLRLMEVLSEVEPTLRWATNKKLHLELAVIRAIQSLAEVNFNQVLDALEQLREASSGHNAISPVHRESRQARSELAGEGKALPAAEEKTTPQAAKRTGPTPEELTPGESVSEGSTADSPDLARIWVGIVSQVREQRPLIQEFFAAAVPIDLSKSNELLLGFAPEQTIAMETLLRPNNRKFIEQLLSERLDAPITVSSVIREGLTPVVLPAKSEYQTNAEDDFKNDPLIQKALEIFQAEIQAAD
ncbi:MAG: DNA polymerase III subunit gamma/tau [Verrucomicrobia bacterium]|nr:DNA polymerase III subunit gamma/tau [Verrucomicrobiota bacterium]